MANCIYCGQPAGTLRRKHGECQKKHTEGRKRFIDDVVATVIHGGEVARLARRLIGIQSQSYLSDKQVHQLLVEGWEVAVERAFDDGILTESEEISLTSISDTFVLTQEDLDRHGAFTRVARGGVVRDLLEGKVPQRAQDKRPLPFNFQKSEKIIWLFTNVDYYEQKTRREYVGGSQGVSIRIAKGLYYRAGGFKGRSISHTETVHGGNGLLAVTNKHIYFGGGSGRAFRIRLDKIVSFEPFSDGIGIMRDAATAKPQTFVTGDGWFTYNVVLNASNV